MLEEIEIKIKYVSEELAEIKLIVDSASTEMSDKDKEELEKVKIYLEYYSNTIIEMVTEIGKEFIKDNKKFTLDFMKEIDFFINKFKENIE